MSQALRGASPWLVFKGISQCLFSFLVSSFGLLGGLLCSLPFAMETPEIGCRGCNSSVGSAQCPSNTLLKRHFLVTAVTGQFSFFPERKCYWCQVFTLLCTLGVHPQQGTDPCLCFNSVQFDTQGGKGNEAFPENMRRMLQHWQEGCTHKIEQETGCSWRKALESTRQDIRTCLYAGLRTRLQISVMPSAGLSNKMVWWALYQE